MPQITIPEEYIGGLAHFLALPDTAFKELMSVLAQNSNINVRDPSATTALISAKVPSLQTKDLRHMMATLLSLSSVYVHSDAPVDEFVSDMVRAMKRTKRPDLSLDGPEVETNFKSRLTSVLTVGTLAIAAKAIVLQHEHEHTLCTVRIFTDTRPIYGADVAAPPAAMAVTHMLKLSYHESDRIEEIHIALDKNDLMNLKAQIERAESKVLGLKKILDIPIVE
jgi:hypothetical protein